MVDGMTLRDYFAAQAIVGLLSVHAVDGMKDEEENVMEDERVFEIYAELAYGLADAMLEKRNCG